VTARQHVATAGHEHAVRRRDGWITLVALIAVLAWDAGGGDLALSRWFGGPAGFPWREAWFTRDLLHDGGRRLATGVLALGLAHAWWWPRRTGPSRAERWRWTAVVLLSLVAVPAIKRVSQTSCPWDLAEFGGVASYVPHWLLGVVDGGPGHCFPSGHAVAAFAFFGMAFLWRPHRPRLARAWLAGTLAAGAVFGAAQLVRGAHYLSHTLWTAWLCWAIAAAAAHAPWALRRLRLAWRLGLRAPLRAWAAPARRAMPAAVAASAPMPWPDGEPPGRRADGR